MQNKNIFPANGSKSNSGFRLEIFNFFIIILTVIVTVALSIVVYKAHTTYDAFYEATEEYIACRTSAEQVHEASELLTNQVRAYTFTGDAVHLENYFNESTVTKRREHALKTIKEYVNDEDKSVFLENAVAYSNELMNIEYYAMRLRLEADNVSKDKYPDAVLRTELKPEDAALSGAEKTELAKNMVQDKTYDDYKDKIYRNVSLYTQDLLDGTRKRETENSKLFSKYQQIQMILIVVLICVLMINVAFTTIFLIRPLRKSTKLIVEQNSLPVKGTKEMRTFAILYNRALQKTKKQQEKLSYVASHDSLTGIQNRGVFDQMCRTLPDTEDITLVLVDIDAFKAINDTRGHE
ncbi:MAG: diguanylate cyclase, partial [Clostridia bacterium]|nr:diguanylate cyclase [Clostridia bacterium]